MSPRRLPNRILDTLRVWPLVAGVIVIIVIATWMALRAQEQADRARRTQTVVERLHADAQALDALAGHAAIARLTANLTIGEIVLRYAGPGTVLFRDTERALDELRELAPGAQTETLAEGFKRMLDRIAGLEHDAQGGGVQHAVATQQRSIRPMMNRLQAILQRVGAAKDDAAETASRRARIAVIVSLAGGMLLLVFLSLALAHVRRRASVDREVRAAERRSEERIRALVEHASDVVTVVDRELAIAWQAPSAQRMLGGAPDAHIGQPLHDVIHPDDRARVDRQLGRCLTGAGTQTFTARVQHADGSWVHVEVIADNRLDDPAVRGLLLSLRDIGERRALEEQLRHQAFHDPLTGLANRTLFGQRLDAALDAASSSDKDVALLFLDLDDFKTINDSLGHEAGDELLRIVARRIATVLRAEDLASRQGGDEFAVLLCDVDDERAALTVAERLAAALTPELELSGRALSISASIGLVMAEPGARAEELLRNADIAMYSAKSTAKGGIRVFEAELHRLAVDRLELGSELVHAIGDGQLVLDYQPIVELASERITGVEALVRWRHPTRGLLGPGQFIPLAEETGAIVGLGAWVLRQACTEVQRLRMTEPGCEQLELSVNVSIKQLRAGDFPALVADVLAATGLPAEALVVELTESLLIEEPGETIGELERIKALGVRLAVDDFGTGHSVLSYLQELPIDIVKIDKSFVDTIHTSPEQAKLVAGIVQLSESLRMEVVAEGIEEAAQADQLRSMRSRLGQGYLYSRPVSPEAIAALLAPAAHAASRR
jgi:diguanylate cyclase (GGDEF)-like protein/PAS domain S-box-containing protein